MDVIAKLRRLMEKKGFSEYRLAKEASLHQSTVANIFHRNTIPSVHTLEAVCKALGITLSEFFSEEQVVPASQDEQKLLKSWRSLSGHQKDLICQLMDEFGPS